MNLYVLTEGNVEATVYKLWITLINPNLSLVEHISDINENNFYILSARGYPYYFDVIENAIEDINQISAFDRLVICVDSEDLTKDEKYIEINSFVSQKTCSAQIRIVIQHFCFETWALGNRKIIRPNPVSRKLREYKRLYNVRNNDPELLPSNQQEDLNRAQFAEKYLRLALNDKFRNLTYTKNNPKALINDRYFLQLKNRLEQTGHIPSFSEFLHAFI